MPVSRLCSLARLEPARLRMTPRATTPFWVGGGACSACSYVCVLNAGLSTLFSWARPLCLLMCVLLSPPPSVRPAPFYCSWTREVAGIRCRDPLRGARASPQRLDDGHAAGASRCTISRTLLALDHGPACPEMLKAFTGASGGATGRSRCARPRGSSQSEDSPGHSAGLCAAAPATVASILRLVSQ
jgi:hypothetical protein